MIFDNIDDFSIDLNNKIINFATVNNTSNTVLLSFIKTYLNEIKNIHIILDYRVNIINDEFIIYINMNNIEKNIYIHINNEIRKYKILKLNCILIY